MKKLRFQIRTWNRAKKLEICVRRIAEEVKKFGIERDIVIFVIDNHSSDETPKVLKNLKEEYPFLVTYRYPKWCSVEEWLPIPEEVLKKVEAEFVWVWGDDDILLKDALPIVWKVLNSKEAENCAVIHAGHSGLTPHSYKIYYGTVIEFFNLMGFAQFVGWFTSVICGKELVEKYLDSLNRLTIQKNCPYYPEFIKTAFPHVLLILYFTYYFPAIVIDYPVAEPIEPQTTEDAERWEKENIGWRYFLFVKELKKLFDLQLFPEKFKPLFFKYHGYNLWDRFLFEMISSRIGVYTRNPRPDEGWEIILHMADLIDDPLVAKQVRISVYLAKELCKRYQALKQEVKTTSDGHKEKKEKLQRELSDLHQKMLFILDEINRPIFEEGWAGKGYKEKN
ncbi:MAG: hypothetical protein J7K20_02635 [Thermodesulfobacterium sp.]|nr:hypothetical protein [Thermodesulfobacterium sp.]